MKTPRWFARLLARWRRDPTRRERGPLRAPPREIDIDLSSFDVHDQVTDYDVHSLGDPIDPPATARRAGR